MTNRILLFVFLIALFLFNQPLRAQAQQSQSGSGDDGRYVVEQRYVQKIEWIGDEYALKYEVVIEKNEGDKYKTHIREFTEKPGLQVSLPVGKYRYRIIPYDYLEQPGTASEWVNVEIKAIPIVSVEVQKADDGSYVLHPYDNEQIVPGVNEIVINNPDDSKITVGGETAKLINLYAGAAWLPLIPLYGRLREIFGSEFYAAGASVRFGALYNKLRWFSPGIELSMSWYALNNSMGGDEISIQTGVIGFNIVAQKKLPNPKMAVTLRAGFALAFQVGEINVEDYSYTTGGLIPQINIEASFLWFAWKRLYVEAGIGFAHLIDGYGNSGFLRPQIGAGWKF
ncbi:hypothetical protein R84B8_01739 [Treponema sp. R8-4-B8]